MVQFIRGTLWVTLTWLILFHMVTKSVISKSPKPMIRKEREGYDHPNIDDIFLEKPSSVLVKNDGYLVFDINHGQGATIDTHIVDKIYVHMDGLITLGEPFPFPNPIIASRSFDDDDHDYYDQDELDDGFRFGGARRSLMRNSANSRQLFRAAQNRRRQQTEQRQAQRRTLKGHNMPPFVGLIAPFWTPISVVPNNEKGGETSGVKAKCFNHPNLANKLPVIEPRQPDIERGEKVTRKPVENRQPGRVVDSNDPSNFDYNTEPSDINRRHVKRQAVDAEAEEQNESTEPETREENKPGPSDDDDGGSTSQGDLETPKLPLESPQQNVENVKNVENEENPENTETLAQSTLQFNSQPTMKGSPRTHKINRINGDQMSQKNLTDPRNIDFSACSKEMPKFFKQIVANILKKDETQFEPLFLLVVSWSNVTSFATRNSMKDTPTIYNFQAIIVIESDKFHIIYNYNHQTFKTSLGINSVQSGRGGGMERLDKQLLTDLAVGYSLFATKNESLIYKPYTDLKIDNYPKFFFLNFSSVADAADIGINAGNTGKPGLYQFSVNVKSEFGMSCYEAIGKFRNQNVTFDTKKFNECPCTLEQAKADDRYLIKNDCAILKIRLNHMVEEPTQDGIRASGKFKKAFKYTPMCCYDPAFRNSLVSTFPSRFLYTVELETEQASLILWKSCCGGTENSANNNASNFCQNYYQIQATLSCSGYERHKYASLIGHSFFTPVDSPIGYFFNGQEAIYRFLANGKCRIDGISSVEEMIFQNESLLYPEIRHVAFQIGSTNFIEAIYSFDRPSHIDLYWGRVRVLDFPLNTASFVIEHLAEEEAYLLVSYLYVAKISAKSIKGIQIQLQITERCLKIKNTTVNGKEISSFSPSLLVLKYDKENEEFVGADGEGMNASVSFRKFQNFGKTCRVSRVDSIIKVNPEDSDIHVLAYRQSEESLTELLLYSVPKKHKDFILNYSPDIKPFIERCQFNGSAELFLQCLLEMTLWISNRNSRGNVIKNPDNHVIIDRIFKLLESNALANRYYNSKPILKVVAPNVLTVRPYEENTFNYHLMPSQPTGSQTKLRTKYSNGRLSIFSNGTFNYHVANFDPIQLAVYVFTPYDETSVPVSLLSRSSNNLRVPEEDSNGLGGTEKSATFRLTSSEGEGADVSDVTVLDVNDTIHGYSFYLNSVYRPSVAVAQCNSSDGTLEPLTIPDEADDEQANDRHRTVENDDNRMENIRKRDIHNHRSHDFGLPPFMNQDAVGVFKRTRCRCNSGRFGPRCIDTFCHFNPCFKNQPCAHDEQEEERDLKFPNAGGNRSDTRDVSLRHDNLMGFQCPACPPFTRGDGLRCEDINECQENPGICDAEASECINSFPFYHCKCNVGFEPADANMTCKAITMCGRPEKSCEEGFSCRSVFSSTGTPVGQCMCPDGTELIDNRCVGINECLDPKTCGRNSECVDLPYSYECRCYHGYMSETSDGKNCVDFNECDRLESPKRNNCTQICNNLSGSYQCQCFNLFSSNMRPPANNAPHANIPGMNCDPKIPCEFPDVCPFPSLCARKADTLGDTCYCPQGYYMKGLNQCNDINECEMPDNYCARSNVRTVRNHSTCINTDGGYFCECLDGFQWDTEALLCRDINECQTDLKIHNCTGIAFCVNTPGSFKCACPPTFEIDPKNVTTCRKKSYCGEVGLTCPKNSECQVAFKPRKLPSSDTQEFLDAFDSSSYNTVETCKCAPGFYTENLNRSPTNKQNNPSRLQNVPCIRSPLTMALNISVENLNRPISLLNLSNPFSFEYWSVSRDIRTPVNNVLTFLFGDDYLGSQILDIIAYPKILPLRAGLVFPYDPSTTSAFPRSSLGHTYEVNKLNQSVDTFEVVDWPPSSINARGGLSLLRNSPFRQTSHGASDRQAISSGHASNGSARDHNVRTHSSSSMSTSSLSRQSGYWSLKDGALGEVDASQFYLLISVLVYLRQEALHVGLLNPDQANYLASVISRSFGWPEAPKVDITNVITNRPGTSVAASEFNTSPLDDIYIRKFRSARRNVSLADLKGLSHRYDHDNRSFTTEMVYGHLDLENQLRALPSSRKEIAEMSEYVPTFNHSTKETPVRPKIFLPTTAVQIDPHSLTTDDLNECDTFENTCPPDMDCVNTFGAFKCVCRPGYILAPHWTHPEIYICQDINECLDGSLNNCTAFGAQCVNVPGSFECRCPPGFATLFPGETKCVRHNRSYWRRFAIFTSTILSLLLLGSLIALLTLCCYHPRIRHKFRRHFNQSSFEPKKYRTPSTVYTESAPRLIPRPKVYDDPIRTGSSNPTTAYISQPKVSPTQRYITPNEDNGDDGVYHVRIQTSPRSSRNGAPNFDQDEAFKRHGYVNKGFHDTTATTVSTRF